VSNVPKLRFAGFEGEWEKKKLKDVGNSVIGLTYSPKDISDKGYLVLRASNVKDNQLAFDDQLFVNMRIPEKLIVHKGDILICARSGSQHLIGKNAYIDKDYPNYTFGAFMCVFRCDRSAFVFQGFQTSRIKKQILENQGARINQITTANINAFSMYFPGRNEQTKIADFLTLIDKKITKQDEKVAALEQYKKELMQKIFSREIRFKDEDGKDYPEWEKVSLSKLFTIKAAGDLDKDLFAKHYDTAHSYPVYANSLNNKGLYGYYKIHTYKKNKLTVTARGVLGYASSKDHDFVAVGRLLVLDPKPETNIFFFEQYINCALKICSEVTGVPQLTAPSLGTYIVSKPSLPEQTRIANFLTLFDRKIEKEKEKLGTLRMQKKGFLQQMFV
jgi:type I restriction enzyme, S subunit